LVVVKNNDHSSATVASNAAVMQSVNNGHIPDVFQASVMTHHQSAFPSGDTPYVAPAPTATTHIMKWYQDRDNGVKDVTFHIHKSHNESDQYRIVTDIPNRVQTVESYPRKTCLPQSIDGTSSLDTNFRAATATSVGPVTVLGRQCQQYSATRADGKTFTYSIDSTGSVCDIRAGRMVYTMVNFTANAPRPQYSDACKAMFNEILDEKQHGSNGVGSIVHTLSASAEAGEGASALPHTLSWWNPWDDAKAAWGDVEHWAGDVYNWAKAHYCQLCKPIMDQVIDEGAEVGSDFICDSVTEGAAADFCGELAKDAVTQACDELDCAKHICSAIGRQNC